MNILKKILPLILTMLMVMCLPVFANDFTDVNEYQEAINVLSDIDVIKGYSSTQFGPNDNVTRWQMALLMSKLLSGKVDTVLWENSTNNGQFTDVYKNHYIGSISYSASRGIVKGTSPTTFSPEMGIKFQDAVTMAVRALGYSKIELDPGYPQSYIFKADELGLLENLKHLGNESVLTRGETAQLLYNMFLSEDVNNKNIALDVFSFVNMKYVLTATETIKMQADKNFAKSNSLILTELKDDGTFGNNINIHKDKLNIINPNDKIGYAFDIFANDKFTEIYRFTELPSQIITTGLSIDTNYNEIAFNNTTYKTVDKYSYKLPYNGNFTHSNNEIIIYNWNTQYTVGGTKSYYTDSFGNYLNYDKNQVVIYRFTPVGSAFVQEGVLISGTHGTLTASYRPPNESDWAKVGYAIVGGTIMDGFKLIKAPDMVNTNAYFKLVVFDDNGDNIADRALYKPYSFGVYAEDTNSKLAIANNQLKANITIVGANPTNGDYVLYTFNNQNQTLEIEKIFPTKTGSVTIVNNLNQTMQIDNITFSIGNANLKGARFSDVLVEGHSYIGKSIKYVVDNNTILAITDTSVSVAKAIFNSYVGNNTNGTVNVSVYMGYSPTNITVSTINGLPYSYAQTTLKQGDLISLTQDVNGNYNITTGTNYTYVCSANSQYMRFLDNIITIRSGNFSTDYVSTAVNAFTPVKIDSATVVITKDNLLLKVTQNVSNQNSINLNINSSVYVQIGDDGYADIIYVNGLESGANNITDGNYDSIVYIDSITLNSLESTSTTSTIGYATYTYDNAINIQSGSKIKISITKPMNQSIPIGYYKSLNGTITNTTPLSVPYPNKITMGYSAFSTGCTISYIDSANRSVRLNGASTAENYFSIKIFTISNGTMLRNVDNSAVDSYSNYYVTTTINNSISPTNIDCFILSANGYLTIILR